MFSVGGIYNGFATAEKSFLINHSPKSISRIQLEYACKELRTPTEKHAVISSKGKGSPFAMRLTIRMT
ncbi:MAG: hypothetical protein CRN43_17940 [Candidatus Nephrothrix sp. EaCA]|nr:MAG: hypothetical protein CRN43_17940 [Candidatus Nephrothrix sp. EaCA]